MSVEAWKSGFDIATLVLLFLTFVAGVGALITGNTLNARQAGQLNQFDSDLTAAKTALAKQQERAANAERETARLEASVAGRELTALQVDSIAKSLKRFDGRSVFISSYSGDAEAARLGIQIMGVLEKAGIRVDNEIGRVVAGSGGVVFGISINCPLPDDGMAQAISDELRDTGKLEVDPKLLSAQMRMGDALIGIMVALKPLHQTLRRVPSV